MKKLSCVITVFLVSFFFNSCLNFHMFFNSFYLYYDFAKYYYEARHKPLPYHYGDKIIKMAQILENSGFITEATRWVDENQLLLNEK